MKENIELFMGRLGKDPELFVRGQSQLRSFETKDGNTKSYEEISAWQIGFTNL